MATPLRMTITPVSWLDVLAKDADREGRGKGFHLPFALYQASTMYIVRQPAQTERDVGNRR